MAAPAVERQRTIPQEHRDGLRKPERVAPYRSNPRDISFNLFEVFGRGEIADKPPFGVDEGLAREALSEIDRFARNEIARTYVDGDRNPPVFDPQQRTVITSELFKETYNKYMELGPFMLGLPSVLGGYDAPPSIARAITIPSIGANPAFHFYTLGPEMSKVLVNIADEREDGAAKNFTRNLAQKIVDNRWGATMVLTEQDAGSDVGAMTTTARQQEDGSWHTKGVKRFITSGEHDLSDNIVHFVLARPVDADGNTKPGTKGLGLFAVSKYMLDPVTAEVITDEAGKPIRNGVYASGLEDKMGIKASTTCEMTFGEEEPAVGYLLGGEHDGIKNMFQVIENARMMIGIKSAETLSRAYLDAVDYANGREQGSRIGSKEKVAIIDHPEVRRSLMMQKAYAEGLRSLVLYTTTYQDDMVLAKFEGNDAAYNHAEGINDLLLPVVKGFGSERANHLLQDALQIYGGAGFMKDFPMEQYLRDAKIDTIYEGTTQIQVRDFFFRKIVKNSQEGGTAMVSLMEEIRQFATVDNDSFKEQRTLLTQGVEDVQAIIMQMVGHAMGGEFDKVGLNTERLLMAFGDLMMGYLLLRQAEVAQEKLGTASDKDKAFYEGKIGVAKFFAREVLPRLSSDRKSAELVDNNIMELPHEALR